MEETRKEWETMEKDKLVLSTGGVIELTSAGGLQDLTLEADNITLVAAAWSSLTPDALKSVDIQNKSGLTVGHYTDLKIDQMTVRKTDEGKLSATISLSVKDDVEKRLDALEEGQEIQDGAIEDLGMATSALAEGGAWG